MLHLAEGAGEWRRQGASRVRQHARGAVIAHEVLHERSARDCGDMLPSRATSNFSREGGAAEGGGGGDLAERGSGTDQTCDLAQTLPCSGMGGNMRRGIRYKPRRPDSCRSSRDAQKDLPCLIIRCCTSWLLAACAGAGTASSDRHYVPVSLHVFKEAAPEMLKQARAQGTSVARPCMCSAMHATNISVYATVYTDQRRSVP